MRWFAWRMWLTAGVMCLCYLATHWVRAGYTFEVAPLGRDLESMPLELDEWRGVDVPLDEHVREILNAQATSNRVYRNRDGVAVVAHISAWLSPETVSEVAPHVPKVCYTNTGWKIIEEREVHVNSPQGDLPLIALLLEKQGERIVVAYWYQMGNSRFNSVDEARRIHRSLWGQRQWPATVKVLLQTSSDSFESGMPLIERFGLLVQRELSAVPEKATASE